MMRWQGVAVTVLTAAFLAACGGGGSDGSGSTPAAVCEGTGAVGLAGTASFDDVPIKISGALDYTAIETKPIRNAEVVIECADGSTVFAETTTDQAGQFSAEIPENVDARIIVRARNVRTGVPTWSFSVVDNTSSNALWALQGQAFNSGTGSVSVEVNADVVWTGDNYSGSRVAGAFSILDTVYNAVELVVSAQPDALFEELTLHWSPSNRACSQRGSAPYSDGCINTSFYTNDSIYIMGDEDDDTDEFDDPVVAHEWGHYYEDNFARSDSVGGSHRGGDLLDIRVAFGEGWGNAFSGMVTGMTRYADSQGRNQNGGFGFSLENAVVANDGWWNETSVQLILFDLFDSNSDGADTVSLGFGPIHDVLTGPQRNTEAFTSIFSLAHYMVDGGHVSSSAMSNILAENEIAPVNDVWGEGRVNPDPANANYDEIIPVYLDFNAAINSGSAADVCVTKAFGEYNKLGNRRFARFTPSSSGLYVFELDGNPSGLSGSDPDFYLFRAGEFLAAGTGNSAAANSTDNEDYVDAGNRTGVELETVTLDANIVYTLDLHDYVNTDRNETTGGEGCLRFTATKL